MDIVLFRRRVFTNISFWVLLRRVRVGKQKFFPKSDHMKIVNCKFQIWIISAGRAKSREEKRFWNNCARVIRNIGRILRTSLSINVMLCNKYNVCGILILLCSICMCVCVYKMHLLIYLFLWKVSQKINHAGTHWVIYGLKLNFMSINNSKATYPPTIFIHAK